MRSDLRPIWAYLLIGFGVLTLAFNFGWLSGWLWALLFFAGAAGFLYYYSTKPTRWWPMIAGLALAGVGATILVGDVGGAGFGRIILMGDAAGAVFLALLGAVFVGVYLTRRQHWWAVIPAGTLLTLALVAWLDGPSPAWVSESLFFIGLATTFGALLYLPREKGKHRWAIYPALLALTLVVPIVLVLVGIFLIWRRRGPHGGPVLPSKEV